MILLLTLLFMFLAYNFNKYIRQYFAYIVFLNIIIGILAYYFESSLLSLITSGYISLALFINVMYASAFKKGSTLSKKLHSVRKEYSIYAVILITPHVVLYFTDMLLGNIDYEWFGIIAYIIVIPLFIISFKFVRKTMSYKLWKNIQRFSYIVYASLFGHVIILGSGENTVYYILMFGVYSALKVYWHLFINHKKVYKLSLSVFVFVLILLFGNIYSESPLEANDEYISFEEEIFLDGVYTGGSYGYKNYRVILTVTIENGEIVDINVIEDGSSSPRNINYSEVALYIADQIVITQSTDIDNIAGATHTIEGVKEAVINALEDAKG